MRPVDRAGRIGVVRKEHLVFLSGNTYARVVHEVRRHGGDVMFKELTDELLDLTATVQGYRRAYLAEYRIILCCTCTVRFS
jgi:hypothetical protein